MQKDNFFIFLTLTILVLSTSFSTEPSIVLPIKKISKSVKKIWKTEKFHLLELETDNASICHANGYFVKVLSHGKMLGYLYSGRVNSCRSGGCLAENSNQDLSFEYFDYYVLLDTNKRVVQVKIYNYQATQGHEVMSHGWLNQFKGLKKGESIIVGKDIEAISGATVSASSLAEDIQQILGCI